MSFKVAIRNHSLGIKVLKVLKRFNVQSMLQDRQKGVIKHWDINTTILRFDAWRTVLFPHRTKAEHMVTDVTPRRPHTGGCQQRDNARESQPVISCWGWGASTAGATFPSHSSLSALVTAGCNPCNESFGGEIDCNLHQDLFVLHPHCSMPVHQLTLEIICIRNAWPSVVSLPR